VSDGRINLYDVTRRGLNIYKFWHRFLPDVDVVFAGRSACSNDMMILSGCCLRSCEYTFYNLVDDITSTAWIICSAVPCFKIWHGFPSSIPKTYTFPWSLPQTTARPISANTPAFTNLLCASILNVLIGVGRLAE